MKELSISSDAIAFTVPGRPTSWQRARTGGGRFFTSHRMRSAEDLIRYYARLAMERREPMTGPVHLVVDATFPIPQRKTGSDPMTGRPDLDNIVKLADALNGIVWRDDAQVVSIEARKRYGDEPGLSFEIQPVLR